ncbi:uncharacterized protein METZ01_LOCUS453541, partial [marine metagenome]
VIKYILTMFVFGTFLMADDSQQYTKPTPTITINDDSDKVCARRRGGKGNKGRRRGGNGLR